MEEIIILFEDTQFRVEHIISKGEISEEGFWYDQSIDELVSIYKGSAILQLEDSEILLKENDSYYIKSHTKHRVSYTSNDCEWICVYLMGRSHKS